VKDVSGEIDANRLADDLDALRAGKIAVSDFRTTWQSRLMADALSANWGHVGNRGVDAKPEPAQL
jgi:hypothetical protein